MTQQPQGPGTPAETSSAPAGAQPAPGPARLLALVAAGLGIVVYLVGFFSEFGLLAGLLIPLLLGGGLLCGASVLPRVGRTLLPGAVAVVVGTLMLLQAVAAGGTSTVLIIALVLAFLEAVAAVGAVLLDSGVVTARSSRPAQPSGYNQQQYPGYPQSFTGPGFGAQEGYGAQPGYSAQPGYGPRPGHGQPQYGQTQYGQPQNAQPQYGQPGQPGYGQAGHGQPQYGGPQYGGAQQAGQQGSGQQGSGQPSSGQPSGGQPDAIQQSGGFGQVGAYGQPVHGAQPGYGQPTPPTGAPEQPGRGQPGVESSGRSATPWYGGRSGSTAGAPPASGASAGAEPTTTFRAGDTVTPASGLPAAPATPGAVGEGRHEQPHGADSGEGDPATTRIRSSDESTTN